MRALHLALLCLTCVSAPALGERSYRNPLPVTLPDGRAVESCADPVVLKGQRPQDPPWVLICTQDPLHDQDRDAQGQLRFRRLPTFTSDDLVQWRFVHEAIQTLPPQATPTAGLWAPEIAVVSGRYHLYYTITDVVDAQSPQPGCDADSAIGVATSHSPLGPWVPEPQLVVPPRRAGDGCSFHWTFDPELLVTPDGRKLLYYGSYGGGLWAQPLDDSGLKPQGEPVRIARSGRYEGAEVVFKDDHYYLSASATNCCNADLTGYLVFVGRSKDPLGPFVDRDGRSFLDARIGGTPALVQNGNRWVGAGHNTVFRDDAGQWWTLYHAVDRAQPHWTGSTLTRRPLLLDPVQWVDGWPLVQGGPSDRLRPAPVVGTSGPRPAARAQAHQSLPRGALLWRDEFNAPRLSSRWRWTRPPEATPTMAGGQLRLPTEGGDLWGERNDAELLATPLPEGDLWIEARVQLTVPEDGDIPQPVQTGFVVFADEDRYFKLVHVALRDTRQTEFAIERPKPGADQPHYGNSVVGAPGDWTTLALHLQRRRDGLVATAYTRAERGVWVRGGTWVHPAMTGPLRLGLVAMGGTGFEGRFDAVRVHRARRMQPQEIRP